MRHLTLLLVLSLAATAAPASVAQAATPVRTSGVVLSASAEKHTLRVVEGSHVVALSYRGSRPAPGSELRFAVVGRHALHLVVAGHVDHVIVSGTVVRDGDGLALRLGDGSLLVLAKSRHPRPGATVRVVVRFRHATAGAASPSAPGTGSPSPSPSAPTGPGCATAGCTFDVVGTVTSLDAAGVVTLTPIGGGASLTAAPGAVDTSAVYEGDFVHVVGTQSAATGVYTITALEELPGCDTPDCTIAFDATVDDVQPDGFSVAAVNGDEYAFAATPGQFGPIHLGDTVHIAAVQDPATGDYQVKTLKVLIAAPQ